MSDTMLQLKGRSPISFELTAGCPGDLVQWLEARDYDRARLRNSAIEAYRLESPIRHGERAVITIFQSGVIVVAGHDEPAALALAVLGQLVSEEQPEAVQEEMVLL